MAEDDAKICAWQGKGPPPGYRWHVLSLNFAYRDARRLLDDDQYYYIAEQVLDLAAQIDPTHPEGLSVDAVDDFFELRERGGILNGLNVRIFFAIDDVRQAIVVLGVIHKQNNGPTPIADKIRINRRLRLYRNRQLKIPVVVRGQGGGSES